MYKSHSKYLITNSLYLIPGKLFVFEATNHTNATTKSKTVWWPFGCYVAKLYRNVKNDEREGFLPLGCYVAELQCHFFK